MNTSTLIQRVWNFCRTLRDDGVGYGDYLEQLTYLLFLKMAHESTLPPYNRSVGIPSGVDWASLRGPSPASASPTRPAAPAASSWPPMTGWPAPAPGCVNTGIGWVVTSRR
ncbi:MAG TPA: type I restriction-modification system subunit M N-terminal domain-containing protein [Aquabacterium sp.]|nr:type I restriction-modification system subunit M N-terminal domain-containing protein [Aquabacterium sp.]HQC94081.1 type I restriction-modification system subunit M N-terminal domain-containing protein [Aquabacterium sp.]